MYIYLIKQHQTDNEEYNNYIVKAVKTEEKAKQICSDLNREYADNVVLVDGLFDSVYNDYLDYHYYDYFKMELE